MKTELLPCKLTEEELVDRGERLAKALKRRDELELERKSSNERNKEDIAAVNGEAYPLRRAIETKTEHREIEVTEIPDHKRGTVTVLRVDTNTVVRERPMREEERQLPLEPKRGRKAPEAQPEAD